MGAIFIPITVGYTLYQTIVMTNFLVLDCPSANNVILGRPSLDSMKALLSTYIQSPTMLPYKSRDWRSASGPNSGSRMLCGIHARETTTRDSPDRVLGPQGEGTL